MKFLYFTALLVVVVVVLHSTGSISQHPIIVLVAFDGFRYDYLYRNLTPILQRIAANGTKAKFMWNQFPTITFPNFHSISTGMYPETHGVLGNSVFNEKRECVNYSYELFHYNEDIVPIWMLNEAGGNGRHSGVMMWPGSTFKYQQKLPTFSAAFAESVPWKTRVDTVLGWLLDDTTPANLILMYFEQPDEAGHRFGPDSAEVNRQLRAINSITEYFLRRLTKHELIDKANLIFLSDHGMTSVLSEAVINLDDYINPETYSFCGHSPGLQILPKHGYDNLIYEQLVSVSNKLKTFQVYKHDEIPNNWHYKNNKRNTGYLIEANLSYVFQDAKLLKGDHGYNKKEIQMHPIFMAKGPLIKQNYTIEPFQNIDLYPLIAHILNLSPPPAHITPNGTLNDIKSMLREDKTKYEYQILK